MKVRAVAGLVVLVGLLPGCGADTPDRATEARTAQQALLLEVRDVPGATSAASVDGLPQTPFCSPIAQAEVAARTYAEGRTATRQFAVGPATVVDAVFDVPTAAARSEVFDRGFTRGVQLCPQAPMRETSSDGTFSQGDLTALAGLPEESVGYTLIVTGTSGPRTLTRAFATTGSMIVVVGASQPGTAVPDVALGPLLTVAIAHATRPNGQRPT